MTFDPNQLLNNPASLLSLKAGRAAGAPEEEKPEPVPPPPYDRTMY